MINTLINKKYSFIKILLLVIAIFSVSHSVSADTYINHTCDDGGLATAVVNISKNIFSTTQSNFTASGYITSTCGPRNMNLTTQNSAGTVITLIPGTYINPGRYPSFGEASTSFQSPATEGAYNVHFVLGVNEPEPVVDLCPDATNPLFPGIQTTLPEGGVIVNGKCKIKISAAVAYSCSNGGNGRIQLKMSFDRPVPENMMIYVAKRSDGNYENCHGSVPGYETYYEPCNYTVSTSNYYKFQFPGKVGKIMPGSFISLTKGMTTHTTPLPKLSTAPRESTEQTDEIACWDNYKVDYKTAAMYFKVGNNSPDIYITDFRLSNYNSQTPNLKFINQ